MAVGVVAFDPSTWFARYPEFAGKVSAETAAAYFAEAELYCDNTATSPIIDLTRRMMLLNMVTAHIAFLTLRDAGITGPIASATEGSVSVSMATGYDPGSQDWFRQSQYGRSFWAATAPYRSVFYVPSPRRVRFF